MRLPKAPAGCERAKSSEVNPRASNSATANASPKAKVAVVLMLVLDLMDNFDIVPTSAPHQHLWHRPTVIPLMVIKGTPKYFDQRHQHHDFTLLPEFEIAISTSPATNIPKSPPCPPLHLGA